jgi:hypothetical protein
MLSPVALIRLPGCWTASVQISHGTSSKRQAPVLLAVRIKLWNLTPLQECMLTPPVTGPGALSVRLPKTPPILEPNKWKISAKWSQCYYKGPAEHMGAREECGHVYKSTDPKLHLPEMMQSLTMTHQLQISRPRAQRKGRSKPARAVWWF